MQRAIGKIHLGNAAHIFHGAAFRVVKLIPFNGDEIGLTHASGLGKHRQPPVGAIGHARLQAQC